MTTSDERSPARRRRMAPAAIASLAGSIAVHAAFAAAALGIAWQLSGDSASAPREIRIHFEDPGAGPGNEDTLPPAPTPVASSPTVPPSPQPAPAASSLQITLQPPEPTPARQLPPSLLNDTSPPAAETPAPTSHDGASASESATELSPATGGVRFAGLGASNARSVVYVVDASGPMVTSMPRVIEELRRSVEQLAATQKFSVVLFRRTDAAATTEVFSPVLMRATPSVKRRLVEWLAQASPAGASNPLNGLEAALALKPDAIFLLSRSIARSGGGVWEDGLDATLARLEELNPREKTSGLRPTLIQTIQFLDDDPTGIMQAIGARHGQGSGYRVVRRGEDIAGRAR